MLRRACRDDLAKLLPLANDPDVRPWILPFETDLLFDTFLGAVNGAQPGTNTFVYVILEAEALVGFITLQNQHPVHRRGYIGHLAVEPKAAGRLRIAVQAVEDVLRIAFKDLNLNRIECNVFSTNPRMKPVLWKVGASHEGTGRESIWHNGEFVDLEQYAVLREEWEARHG